MMYTTGSQRNYLSSRSVGEKQIQVDVEFCSIGLDISFRQCFTGFDPTKPGYSEHQTDKLELPILPVFNLII